MQFEPEVNEIRNVIMAYGRCISYLYYHSRRGDKKAAYVLKMADSLAKQCSIKEVVEYVENQYPGLLDAPQQTEMIC